MMPALLTNPRSASDSSYDRDSNIRGRLSISDSFSNGREDSSSDRRELTGTGSRCDVKVNSRSREGTSRYSRRRRWSVVTVAAVVMVMAGLGAGSELPDRECCDSAPPPPPHYLTVTSTSTTSTTQPPVHGSGSEGSRDKKEIMNCLQAKIECERDANCSALLKVVPILCGPEIVACSTVTVSRCQAALRTLVLFTWFVPTCVCGNPKYDIQCNTFKDLLFEHPCVYLNRKDMNTDPLQHIPACDRAADLCRDDLWCKPRLDRFRTACKIRDGHCRNRDRERCVRAWLQVRDTPLLGCICPEDGDKKCSRLYSLVNQNPCVGDSYPARVDAMSRVSEALGTPLTRKVPMPTAAVSLLVVSMSHSDPLYPLSVIHHFFQHRPGEGNDYNGSLDLVRMVAATCHSALLDCQDDEGCSSHLLMAKGHCTSYCHQNACRRSIQDMYKHLMENNQDLALKIALCVCKTGEGRDHARCLRAQLYFHPPCAQRTETLPATQCHHLGQDCRTDRVCRYRLEQYEVGCAADLLTGECAGSPSSCRMGVVGVLGSRLHTDCECNSLDMQELHQCYSWKRLLWGNPCVVEAQLTYHLETLREKQVEEEEEEEEEEKEEEEVMVIPSAARDNTRKKERGRGVHDQVDNLPPMVEEEDDNYNTGDDYDLRNSKNDPKNDVELVNLEETMIQPRKGVSTPRSVPWEEVGGPPPPPPPLPPTTTTTTTTSTTTPTTTTTTTTTTSTTTTPTSTTTALPTTTLPDRYCEISRPWEHRPRIIGERESIRLYRNGDKDCSELCFCELHQEVKCQVLDCVENRPCETAFAVYNHNAPAYQAYRGECVCYSGDFICMRPRSEEYQLPSGLFLLLGYSKTEEALLKAVTGSSALDALMPLQMVVSTLSSKMGEECRLEMYQHTKDNLVLQVRHFRMSNSLGGHSNYTTYKMQEERDRCERPVRQVASMVNKRDPVIHDNVRLSLFVLAEIIDNVPKFRQFNGARPSPLAAGVWACWWAWWMSIAVLVVGGGALDDVFGSLDAGLWRTKTTATPTMRVS